MSKRKQTKTKSPPPELLLWAYIRNNFAAQNSENAWTLQNRSENKAQHYSNSSYKSHSWQNVA